jgi:S-adenosylmethionine hydrolase
MKIITLTTDMGLSDYYVAVLKGSLLKLDPSVVIIDITHQVTPFNISSASYYISAAYKDFPEGTVHIIGVESEPIINSSEGSFPAIMLFKGHYFVANDNGIFALLLKGEQPDGFWLIDNVLSHPAGFRFPTKNIFVPAAVKIAQGTAIDTFASATIEWKIAHSFNATIEEHLIKGQIIHIDHYGNAITNIGKDVFDRFDGVPFTILFRRKDYYIDEISHAYNDVTPGERLALFNDNGLLEIAINKGATGGAGGADELFGLRIGDVVRIEFNPRGSAKTIDSLFNNL